MQLKMLALTPILTPILTALVVLSALPALAEKAPIPGGLIHEAEFQRDSCCLGVSGSNGRTGHINSKRAESCRC